jgi:diguanylate cyclase (GGDEF)-like protein
LELARSKRHSQPLTLLLLDIDGLKRINDHYGHSAGDTAIRAVAMAIRAALRGTDIGARWGGDEFAILAPNASLAAGLLLAERLRELMACQPTPWPVTVSVGVVTLEPNTDSRHTDASELMRAADAALYEAKGRGRNRVFSVAASTSA